MTDVASICFVCLGNIVRSPLAENLFIYQAEKIGVAEEYQVDSAGLSAWHLGESPDSRMRRVAARHGIRYDGSARQFLRDDFDRFDLIIAMDSENYRELSMMARTPEQQEKIHLLREFDPLGGVDRSVPDPYYEGQLAFEEVFFIVERSVRGLLLNLEGDKVGL